MAKVLYVIGHWTGGNYKPCDIDRKCYQTLIDGSGRVIKCNLVGKTSSTGGMNSITYNISCCGGLPETPITKVQQEAFFCYCAKVLKRYSLTPYDFYTHAEIGEMCKNKTITKLLPWNNYLPQNIGKIDLTKLPDRCGTPEQTGDFIRSKIKWYYNKK